MPKDAMTTRRSVDTVKAAFIAAVDVPVRDPWVFRDEDQEWGMTAP
jgi:hypothetical protein